MKAADGMAVMFGVHSGEKVRGGLVLWFSLPAAPMQAQAVAQAAEHAHPQHGLRSAHTAQVVVMRDVQTLMQAALDAPGGTRPWH